MLNRMLPNRDVRFVADADVRRDIRHQVKEIIDLHNGDERCEIYSDYRELLDRDDIDGILTAAGDRWHAPMAMNAAEAGKDVYSEKPCAISIDLSQRLAETIRRTGCVFQAGTQRRSISNYIHIINLARSGALGEIHTVHASIYALQDRYDWLPARPEPPKEAVDWDAWLGPAPWRPFNATYINGGWRAFYDFDSGSRLHDWGAHTADLCQAALGTDGTAPVRYEPKPDVPNDNVIECTYADGKKLILRRSGWLGLGTCPVRFEGSEGWVESGDSGRIQVSSDTLRETLPAPTLAGTDPYTHCRNFFDCMKTRGRTACNEDAMEFSHILCHAAAIAWKLKKTLEFDPVKVEFTNSPEANRQRVRAMRARWAV